MKLFYRTCFQISILFLVQAAQAQNYWDLDFWQQNPLAYHGSTLKKKYVITTPGYMGPNALPVPEIKKGLIEKDLYLKFSGDFHFGKGDQTQNIYGKFYYPVVPGKLAIELYGVPYEHFSLSDQTKAMRRIVDAESSGYTFGDVYFGTVLQVFKNREILPDMTIGATCKTASGNNLLHARFTDAPAYFFDVALGKNMGVKNRTLKQTRVYGSGGLYVWQTNSDIHRQDDAFLYGIGAETSYQKWQFNQTFAGYIGYLEMRDKPSVYRLQITRNQSKFNYGLEYQTGLNDFDYHTFRVSLSYFPCRKSIDEVEKEIL